MSHTYVAVRKDTFEVTNIYRSTQNTREHLEQLVDPWGTIESIADDWLCPDLGTTTDPRALPPNMLVWRDGEIVVEPRPQE